MKPKFPCKNHKEELTAKKCFHCQKYICSACQNVWSHHIFCSVYCYIKYQLNKVFGNLKKEHIIVLTIVLILQLFTILFVWNTSKDISEDSYKDNQLLNGFMTEDTTSFFNFDTTSQPDPYELLISGKAIDNTLLGLWHNGKFVQSSIVQDNKYKFLPSTMILGENNFKIYRLDPQGRAVLVDSIIVFFKSPKIARIMKSISQISTDEKILSLTFDAGSINNGGEEILRILREHEIKTTFFLTGRFIKKNIKLIETIIKDGHEIGNHTYSHPHLTKIEKSGIQTTLPDVNRKSLQKELLTTDSVFYSNFNRHLAPFWRAPFGEYNREILQWAAELGYRHIRWSKNGDTMDWVKDKESELYKSANQIYDDIMKLEFSGKLEGAILLMHFGSDRDSDYPYLILPKIIGDLQAKNYRFLSVGEMLISAAIY